MVFRASGYTPERVSSFAIEFRLSQYQNLQDLILWSYQENGHSFMVIYPPNPGDVPEGPVSFTFDASTGQLTVANNGTGSVAVQSFTLNFDSAGGTFTQTVVAFQMSAILERVTDGSHRGSTAKRSSFGNGGSYSNTDTTVTFGAATYDVVYGHISGTGVADSFTGVRSEGKNCLAQVQAQRR